MFYVINISVRENCLQSLRKNKDIKNGCKAHFISLTFIYRTTTNRQKLFPCFEKL